MDAPNAAGLMRPLAFLAPEPVPLGLLLAREDGAEGLAAEAAGPLGPLLGDPIAIGDAMVALSKYSLVTLAGDGLVQVHRLLQVVTCAQLIGCIVLPASLVSGQIARTSPPWNTPAIPEPTSMQAAQVLSLTEKFGNHIRTIGDVPNSRRLACPL